jgi:PAS domain S-box-containing protein
MNYRFVIIFATVVICFILSVVVNLLYEIDIIYTHLFYIPIILTGIWYPQYASVLAASLGLIHIACDYKSLEVFKFGSVLRAVMFMVVGYVTSYLARKQERLFNSLRESEEALKQSNDELEKRVEERTSQLTEAMHELKIVLDNAPVAISKIIDRKQVWVNDKTEFMFKYPKEEMEFQTTRKLYTSDEAYEKLGQEAYPVLAQGMVFETVQELIRKDGGHIFVRYIGKAVEPPDMSKGTIWLLEDITDHKRMEEALILSSEIITNMSEGVVLIRVSDGTIVYANPKFDTMFGYNRGELEGKNISIVNAPSDKKPEEQAEHISAMLREKGVWRGEIYNEKKDGTPFWCFASVSTFQHSDYGEVWISVHTDINNRKRAEELLRQERELYLDLVNNQPAGIYRIRVFAREQWRKDAWSSSEYSPHCVELVSDRFCSILGIRRQVYEKTPGIIVDLVYPEDKVEFVRQNEEANAKLINFQWEGRVCVGGKIIWVHLESLPRPIGNGDVIWTGILYDISEQKQTEKKIQASLLEKETMLKEIHHRVKNNLQVISSLLSLQSSHLQDEKAKEALEESMGRLETMASIHTQLYQSQDLARVDFTKFIQELIGNIRQSYGRAQSPIEIHVDAGEISLGIDNSIPCGLILNELIANALKHAFPEGKEGEIKIEMRLEDNQVVLTVQDNGIGFSESIDFTNVKSLGLDMVNTLVRQMHGKIDMLVDGGTTWTITFTLKNERECRND